MTQYQTDVDPRERLAERLFEATLHAFEAMTVYLGDVLGLYRALRDDGPATARELAARAGIAERYAREWLEGQAAAGLLSVDDVDAGPHDRRFELSDAHAEVLTDPDSVHFAAPLPRHVAAFGPMLPQLREVFASGEGIAWSDYGPEMARAQADLNRPWLNAALGAEYLPSIADVHQRLSREGARVADLGCGAGWAGIAIAHAYPKATVHGYDTDSYALGLARQHAADQGVAERVTFTLHDLTEPVAEDHYDLAVTIETVHDLARPVAFLDTVRRMLAPGGVALVADEKVGEVFTAPADELERLFYAASVLCCLPCGLAEQPSAATGTVIRPATMRHYATEAGFARVRVLDEIDHDSYRFYRLDP